jgi:uncharacterized RDD family membrane protein YckC
MIARLIARLIACLIARYDGARMMASKEMDISGLLMATPRGQSRRAQPAQSVQSAQSARSARQSSAPLASLGLRCGAFLIDYILTLMVLAIPLVIAIFLKRRWYAPTAANILVGIGYLAMAGLIFFNWIYSYVQSGRSFGKSFMGLRVVRLDGGTIDYKTAILRHIVGYPLSVFCFGMGLLWMLWDRKQQGWHDKIAQTMVIRD